MSRLSKTIWLLMMTSALVSACGNASNESHESRESDKSHEEHGLHESHRLPNGDIQERTADKDTLPSFLDSQSGEIRTIYRLAAHNADLLAWIPCYCGCADSANHQSNLNCFIAKIEDDGSLKWDDHGTRCGVCLEIALESVEMQREGKTTKEIRAYIDDKYKSDYAEPTPTPMPL